MMKTYRALLSLFLLFGWALPAFPQDTLDVFSQHLHLAEVVVTGLTGEVRLNEMPSSVRVLDRRELSGYASSNIIDAIARTPGVSQITVGGGISKPVIRGLGYNRVVVMADGIRQEGQQWGDEHGVELDGNSVNSVEIIKGPASLMYGSDALAGVVIFHPAPSPAPGTFRSGVSGEYQSNAGLAAYSVYHDGHLKDLVWNLRFSDKYAHAYHNAADGAVPGSQFRERAFSGKLGLNRTWGFSRLTLSYYHLTPGMIEGYEDGVLEGPCGYGISLPFQQVYHYKAVLDNTIKLGEGRIKALLGFQHNRRQEFEESAGEPGLDFRLNTLNYDLKYLSAMYDGWKFSGGVGGMLQQSDNLGEEVLIPAYRLLDAGLFLTATKSFDKLHLSGGIRGDLRVLGSLPLEGKFEAFDRVFPGVTGSIGLVYSPLPSLNLRANLARGFRAPNLNELSSNGVHEGTFRYERGSRTLAPEYSLQGDLGADFSIPFMNFSVAAFCNRINHYIYAARTGNVVDGLQEYSFTQADALLYGGEASLDVHPVHSLHLETQFSYVRGTFAGGNLPLIPAPRLAAEIKWEITHDARVFNNAWIAFRVDARFAQPYFLEATETATPAYTLLGLSAATDILLHGRRLATLTLMADNLADTVYTDHLSRLKYAGVRNMGRNITVKLEIPIM